MAEVTTGVARISAQDLKRDLEAGKPVYILDVRSQHAWQESAEKIQGAHRYEPNELLAAERVVLPIDKATPIVTY